MHPDHICASQSAPTRLFIPYWSSTCSFMLHNPFDQSDDLQYHQQKRYLSLFMYQFPCVKLEGIGQYLLPSRDLCCSCCYAMLVEGHSRKGSELEKELDWPFSWACAEILLWNLLQVCIIVGVDERRNSTSLLQRHRTHAAC